MTKTSAGSTRPARCEGRGTAWFAVQRFGGLRICDASAIRRRCRASCRATGNRQHEHAGAPPPRRARARFRRDPQRQRRQLRVEAVVERGDRNVDQQLPHRRQESEQIGHARVVHDDIAGLREQAPVALDEIRATAQDLAREQRLLRQLTHQRGAALDHVIAAADVGDAEPRQREIARSRTRMRTSSWPPSSTGCQNARWCTSRTCISARATAATRRSTA